MIDRETLYARLAELPLYIFEHIVPAKLEFSQRIRSENSSPLGSMKK